MATRYDYARQFFSLRMSVELDKLVTEFSQSLNCTKTDIILYLLVDTLDPTGLSCPDTANLPPRLRDNMRSPADRLRAQQTRTKQALMDFFSNEEEEEEYYYGGDDIGDNPSRNYDGERLAEACDNC